MKITFLLNLLISMAVVMQAQSPYISKVFEFCPAPGQFVNELPKYEEGDTQETMILKVENEITGDTKGMVSLGAYGGYIVFGFDHLVENRSGKYDFKIWGNAYYQNSALGSGACEPGIVMVAYDTNGNGIPDDTWYELAGSEYDKPQTIKNYEITYYKPDPEKDPTPDPNFPFFMDTTFVKWTDNQGGSGYITQNLSHKQPYYAQWVNTETLVYKGTKLANNGVAQTGSGQNFTQYAYSWGYADNHPNDNNRSNFDIGWAVDEHGNKVELTGIHFVKVYTGVNQSCGRLGETSTEIMGAEDFHIQGIDIDILSVKTETLPNARACFKHEQLHLINLEGCYCTLYNINGQLIDNFNVISSNYIYNRNLISGVYILNAQKQNAVKIFKLIQ